ncbi:hypothetical protein BLNAU_20306 [Blattamonas nauphoetae]|uniref:Uncharacterized protein n=1 Tax=Blattamonas nauphoetae TaxID=2049346 RepID=A0ABQ9WZM7_9EUKA|nr:hypothetical protein BLNAU_20306 [Blattamonas nauphoetae]
MSVTAWQFVSPEGTRTKWVPIEEDLVRTKFKTSCDLAVSSTRHHNTSNTPLQTTVKSQYRSIFLLITLHLSVHPFQTTSSIVSDVIATSDIQDLFTDAIFVVYQIEPIDFRPPSPIVIPGPVSSGVYIMPLTPLSLIPTITWIECDLDSFSTDLARIFVSGTGFLLGTYFTTFSDGTQNQYAVQISVEDYGIWTLSSDVIPISVEPSDTDLVYDTVYSDFKIYWNGVRLVTEVTSFTAPSASPFICVTGVSYLQMTVTSFHLEFMTNRPFSGKFEVTFIGVAGKTWAGS